MTKKDAFTDEEWTSILEGPTSAGMMVITASRGGTLREMLAESKAYAEARAQHGESELLDEIVSSRPKMDHTRYRSAEDLQGGAMQHLGDAVKVLQAKATPDELDGYRKFVLTLCSKVAAVHRQGDADGPAETAAIQMVSTALGVTGT
jgi:hypothetical protein